MPVVPDELPAPVAALSKAGLWRRVADYWLITEFGDTQTTRDSLEALARGRRTQRDKKRRQRARAARADAVPGTVPGTVPGDGAGDVPKDTPRTGQARTGALTGTGDQQRTCAKDGCPLPRRSGCRTCWDHAYLEATR
jgi:hypothetical protein